MPIYEYVCPLCGHKFEKRVPYGTDEVPCPAPRPWAHGLPTCDYPVRRVEVPSSPAVTIFKAGGFTRSSTNSR